MKPMTKIGLSVAAASTAFLFPQFATAGPNDLCVPGFQPVPHAVPDGKTPVWWVDQTYEEQRWNGASQRSFSPNSMTSEVGWMRTLYNASDRYLYVHFHSETDTSVDPNVDHVVLALTPATGTKQLLMVIDPYSAPGCGTGVCSGVPLDGNIQYAVSGGVSGWTDYLPASDTQLEPWTTTGTLAENPMIWAATQPVGVGGTRYVYDVKLRVKMPVALGAGANLYADMVVGTPAGVGGVNVIQYPWPRDKGVGGANEVSITSASTADNEIRVGMSSVDFGNLTGAATCSDGIVLAKSDIYTDLGGNKVRNDAAQITRFYAAFTNNTGATVTAGEVQADFYLAEWGINPSGDIWQKMNTSPVPLAGGNVPDGGKADGAAGSGQIELSWSPSAADVAAFGANSHQCIQAKLSAAGGATLDFGNDSAWRNLDFVTASAYEDTASVFAVGAGAPPEGKDAHRFWLHLEPSMMPSVDDCKSAPSTPGCSTGNGKALKLLPSDTAAKVESEKRAAFIAHLEGLGDGKSASKRGAKLLAAMNLVPNDPGDVVGTVSWDEMPSSTEGATSWEELPRLVVRGFKETGQKVGIKGTAYPMLTPWGSFGYVVEHEGSLSGWEYFLFGNGGELVDVGNGWYYIDLKDGEVANVGASIRAIDDETKSCAEDPAGAGCSSPKLQSKRPWSRPGTDVIPTDEEPTKDEPTAPLEAPRPEKKKGCNCDVDPGPVWPGATLCLVLLAGGAAFRRRR